MNSGRSWYLIYTKPRQECLAREHLSRQGYETYLPRIHQTRRRNGRQVKTIEAFFPRYLFIRLDTETDNWAPIRSTVGVSKLVRFDGMPATVPDDLIQALQGNEDEDGIQTVSHKDLKRGDKVTIIDGPLAGYQGIYQQMNSAERVAVLVDLIGKNTLLNISVHDLQIAVNA
jgi:transcriptional antiterminator RfaH